MESLTATADSFAGCTPGYAAPEQFRNRKKEIDARADLFSIGVVLYEMATGENPHRRSGNLFEILRSVENSDLPALQIARAPNFCDLVASLTSRFRTRRPNTAAEALTWFRAVETELRS
jgi:serine/threonine protein kinase